MSTFSSAPGYMDAMQADDTALSIYALVDQYSSGIQDLREGVHGLTPHQILSRPVPGKWSTLELVAHLSGSEIYFADRIERTLALEKPLLVGVDEQPYPDRIGFKSLDIEEELALFTAIRKHVTRVLRQQPEEAWTRVGIHTETGLVTVRQLVLQPIRHLKHHLVHLRAKRAALGI